MIDPNSKPEDFRRPGHVFPLRSVPGGVLRRAGHTETTTDLAEINGLRAAAAKGRAQTRSAALQSKAAERRPRGPVGQGAKRGERNAPAKRRK